MLSAAVDVGRDAAAAGSGGRARIEVPLGSSGPEDERRVDDHHVEPVGGEPQRLDLGLVLGVDVGDPEASGA